MTTYLIGQNGIQSAWRPYQCQHIHPVGASDNKMTTLQRLSPCINFGLLFASVLGLAMLVAIYFSMPSTNPAAALPDSSPGVVNSTTTTTTTATTTTTTATTTTTPIDPILCKCQGHSSESLLFAYGPEANDYETMDPVKYPINGHIEYTLLADNRKRTPMYVQTDYDDGAMLKLAIDEEYVAFFLIANYKFDPSDNSAGYHRKASAAEKAIFNCLIPSLNTKEAYVFTWINYTTAVQTVGTFQIVAVFDEDSTTYVIKNYEPGITLTRGDNGTNRYFVYDDATQAALDRTVVTADVTGKRDIIAASEYPFDNKMKRVEEQRYGPC